MSGQAVSSSGLVLAKAQAAMTKRTLKTAEPTMVPMPTSLTAMNTPMMEVNSSGAEPPAAINVAPATSGLEKDVQALKGLKQSKGVDQILHDNA